MTRLRTRLRHRVRRDERGASLVLAIVFMVVAGTIGGGLTLSVTSGLGTSNSLTNLRNREYDADAAINMSIARIRAIGVNAGNPNLDAGSNPTECPAAPAGDSWTTLPNGNSMFVTCSNQPVVGGTGSGGLALQNDVAFSACLGTAACTKPIITAQVKYVISGSNVTTVVQAWSVNG